MLFFWVVRSMLTSMEVLSSEIGFGDLIKLCFVLDVICFLDFLF